MRVGTQGLFHLCLKTFVAPFLPARLTGPGSPRMENSHLHKDLKLNIKFSRKPALEAVVISIKTQVTSTITEGKFYSAAYAFLKI